MYASMPGERRSVLTALRHMCRLGLALAAALLLPANPSAVAASPTPPTVEWMRGAHSVVTFAELSADGSLLMTASGMGSPDIKLRRVSDGMLLRTITVDALASAALSKDGQYVAASCNIGPHFYLALWRAATGELLRTIPASTLSQTVVFSDDGALVAAHDGANGIGVWRVGDGRRMSLLADAPNTYFTISPNGLEIAQSSYNLVRIYSVATGAFLHEWYPTTSYMGPPRFFGWPVYSPNSAYVTLIGVVGDPSGGHWTAGIFDAATGALVDEVYGGPAADIQTIWWRPAWRADRLYHLLHPGAGPYTVAVTDVVTGAQTRYTGLVSSSMRVPGVSASADGRYAAAGGYAEAPGAPLGVVGVHDTVTGHLLPIGSEHRSAVTAVAFSPDGQVLATGGEDHTVKLWNRDDGTLIRTIPVPQIVAHLDFSPDGRSLAVAYGVRWSSEAYPCEVRSVADGSVVLSMSPPYGEITEARFTPDGASLVTADAGGYVRVWRATDGANTASVLIGSSLQGMAVSPDGSTVVVSPYGSGRLYWLRLPDLQYLWPLTGISGIVRSLTFTRDGTRLIVSGGGSGSGSVWAISAADRSLLWSVTTMPNVVFGMDVDPAGEYIAAASGNPIGTGEAGHLYFYRVSDGSLAQQFDQEAGYGYYGVLSLAFSPDGKSFAYARYDSAVVVAQHPFASIDRTPPVTTVVVTSAPNAAGWANGSETYVSFSAADSPGGTGVKSITVQVEGFNRNTETTLPFALALSMEGTTWVKFHSEDNAGNVEAERTLTLHMDRTAPVSTATVNGAAPAGPYRAAAVEISATDALSGVKAINYTVDGGAQQQYNGPISVSSGGAHTIAYWAVDAADNAETARTITIVIDRTAPTTTATVTPAPNAAGWTNGPQTRVGFTAVDDPGGTGVKSITYQVETGPVVTTTPNSPAVVMSMEGTRWVKFHAEDNVGNVEAEQTITLHMDRTAPTITSPDVAATATSSLTTPVTFAPTATDGLSGVVGGVACSPASGSAFPLGVSMVTCNVQDAAGNAASAWFKVNVTYSWSGVLQPVNADGSSVFRLGKPIPMKFGLTGASAGITNAVANLSYTRIGDVSPTVNEADSQSAADTGNQFRYDPVVGQYVFVMGTKNLTAGQYRLIIDLHDGVSRSVVIGLH